ncbi:EsaB/YukD family protein [Oceanobacillus bengalensis]|uniref:Ubiquitin-like domain-containing protein n=1 Tax=Oceanobacillus bengalensis TaxID=1435466 RepID=A0A494Z2V7_9BACI|nr:EsaB/YukD family protein [Oceanobacillus bengalensis]RKQ16839.1 hypothetical protein D8M05_06185 [Oceanobacillus bengalensis]
MAQKTHINVTIDLSQLMDGGACIDLRIPIHLSVKQLVKKVMEALNIADNETYSTIKVVNKNLLIADDDHLADYPVTDGDILVVIQH